MSPREPSLFSDFLENQPDFVRHLLETALQLRDLRQLYDTARVSRDSCLTEAVLATLDVGLKVSDKDLARIPATGPVVVIANHPFGLLDGLLIDSLILRVRSDVKILTNSLISSLPELQERCLPVEVFGKTKRNVGSLRRVIERLRDGQGVAVFPSGEVSHWQARRRCVTDPDWNSAPVRWALHTQSPVVPVYISGGNGLGFQIAGLIHPRLRTARLPGELINKRGREVEVRIGTAIRPPELERFGSPEEATSYVRARTYALEHRTPSSPKPPAKLRSLPLLTPLRTKTEVIAAGDDEQQVQDAFRELYDTGGPIIDTPDYAVVVAPGDRIPVLMREIGRLREITFRGVGEGSGRSRDIDVFDTYYQHLILWHKSSRCVVGGYRLAWTADVLPARGIAGLYTNTLFRFHPQFFQHLGSSVELGRSFVRPEFQKDYAPLMLLWQAIGRYVGRRPEAPVLFGPVSISADYSEASRELIVRFVSRRSFRKDLAELAVPRHPFRSRLTSSADLRLIESCLDDVESLAAPLSDFDNASGVPVLLRQYLKLGGKVAGFNLDRKFSNALDGLLIVDLRETAPKLLSRYMGAELASAFLSAVCPLRSA